MLSGQIDPRQLLRLQTALGNYRKKLPQEIATAINATSRKTKTAISKEIRKELAVSAKGVNRTLKVKTKANKNNLAAVVSLKKTDRIALKEFKARQTKKGVSYRISKTGGRKTIQGAFISDALNQHVYKRKGRARLPIHKLHGPSPWGVFRKQRLIIPTKRQTKVELRKQIERRIRYRELKASGKI